MKNIKVYFRHTQREEDEFNICSKYFSTQNSRINIEDSLVVGRYSVLPFYKELENDLKLQNSKLINSFIEHSYIASFDWYYDLKKITPKTYFSLEEVPKNGGPFVLKGKTNSRKSQWKEKMFADNYLKAANIYLDLSLDPLIGDQGIIIRDYVPLESFGESLNGQPFANEWRMFFYKEELLSFGYYWVSSEYIPSKEELPVEAIVFAKEIAKILSKKTNFFVIDIARTNNGEWILIEVNDAQMSGLSDCNSEELYSNLKKALSKDS